MAAACSIADLPTDVLQRIFAALTRHAGSTLDMCSCLSVCKRWNTIGSCQELWLALLQRPPEPAVLFGC